MAYIKNTTNVYAGPSVGGTYISCDTLATGHTVAVLFKEGNFYYVGYTTDTPKWRGGYVETAKVADVPSSVKSITITRSNRYVTANTSVYYGPSSYVYDTVDQLQADVIVTFLGYKDSNNEYALIEYSLPGSGEYKRVFINAGNLCVNKMYKYRTFKYSPNVTQIPPEYPMGGATVTQGFNDTNTQHKGHLGYDLYRGENAAALPLFAGTVAAVKDNNSGENGRVVCLKHNVDGCEFYTAYCHLASIDDKLKNTEETINVSLDTPLGIIGGSGDDREDCYNTHLHVCAFTGRAETEPMGYCGNFERFDEVSDYANDYYYGPDNTKFPNSNGLCFYDPYGVVSTNAEVIREYYGEYNPCDVNRDGDVNQLDVTRAQRYFGTNNSDCDVNGDGTVDISDLIMIVNNFTE